MEGSGDRGVTVSLSPLPYPGASAFNRLQCTAQVTAAQYRLSNIMCGNNIRGM